MSWIIVKVDDTEYAWSNSWGWVDTNSDYDSFTDEEHRTLDLPIGGKWERVPWSVEV